MAAVGLSSGLRRVLATRALSRATRRRFSSVESVATARLNDARASVSVVSEAASAYTEYFSQYPLRANAFVSGTLCAVGDALAQGIEVRLDVGDAKSFDPLRTARMATYGTIVCGPLLYGWYSTLHVLGEALRVSYVPLLGSRLSALLPGLASLQTEVASGHAPGKLLAAKAPFLNLYFATMGVLEGRRPAEIYEKTKQAFHRAWALSLLVWTPIQLLNLSLVPPPLQPAVVSAVNVGWKATLSLLNAMHDTAGPDGPLRRHSTQQAAEVDRLRDENDALRSELSDLREQLVVMWEESEQSARLGAAAAAPLLLPAVAPAIAQSDRASLGWIRPLGGL